jgi:hypothetical protein
MALPSSQPPPYLHFTPAQTDFSAPVMLQCLNLGYYFIGVMLIEFADCATRGSKRGDKRERESK